MTVPVAELRERLDAALVEVSLAEKTLEATLRDLGRGGPRAEKIAVTADVNDAFVRVRRAHDELTRVRDLIALV